MKRLLLAFLFVTPAFAQIPGPWGIFGGPILSSRLPLGAPVGATAFTSDMGLMVSNGLTWAVFTGGGGSGSVTSISVVGANGFSGSVATPTTTPALTLETSITGPLKGAGGALQAAGNVDIYSLFGCAGVSTTYLNGAGGCSTPAGGNVSNTGSPTSGQLAEWTNATTVQGLTPAGDLSLSGSTFTVTKTNGTPFGTFATQNYASPPAIGATTPAAGAFTTLSASSGTFSAVSGGVTVGSPTGGVKGAGTLNMAGCYINGVACAAGGTVNSGTLGQLGYYAASGVAISPLSLASNFVVNSGTLSPTQPLNAQTGTSYAIASTDAGKLVTRANASSCADTIVAATTTGYTAGFSFDYENNGTATCTLTPTTSTINAGSALTVAANTGCTVSSDGTNYQVSACTALPAPYTAANIFPAQAYGSCTWTTASNPTTDVGPCINLAIAAAAAAGGGTVTIPATGTGVGFGVTTPIVQANNGVHVQGAGLQYGGSSATTTLIATSSFPSTGTMFTIASSGAELSDVSVSGINFNANNYAKYGFHATSVASSTFEINCTNAGGAGPGSPTTGSGAHNGGAECIIFDTGTGGNGNQNNVFSKIYGATNNYAKIARFDTGGSPGAKETTNTSQNVFGDVFINMGTDLGDGIVIGDNDNTQFVGEIRCQGGCKGNTAGTYGAGRPFIITNGGASTGYTSPDGVSTNGSQLNPQIRIAHTSVPVAVLGYQTGSTIVKTAGSGTETLATVTLTPTTPTPVASKGQDTITFTANPITAGVAAGMVLENCGNGVMDSGMPGNDPVLQVTSTTVEHLQPIMDLKTFGLANFPASYTCTYGYGITSQAATGGGITSGTYVITSNGTTWSTTTVPTGGHSQSGISAVSEASGAVCILTFTDFVIPLTAGGTTCATPVNGDAFTITVPTPAAHIGVDGTDFGNAISQAWFEAGAMGRAAYQVQPIATSATGANNLPGYMFCFSWEINCQGYWQTAMGQGLSSPLPYVLAVGGVTGSSTVGSGFSVGGYVNSTGVVDGAAYYANITCLNGTGCASGTLLMDLQTNTNASIPDGSNCTPCKPGGGTSEFKVDYQGNATAATSMAAPAGNFPALTVSGGSAAFTSSPITVSGALSSAAALTNGVGWVHANPTYTDSSGTGGTITTADLFYPPSVSFNASVATTYTTVYDWFFGNPTCTGNATCTNLWALGASSLRDTGALEVDGTVSGAGMSTYLASPPAIGGTAAAAVTGTTVTANTNYVHGVTVLCSSGVAVNNSALTNTSEDSLAVCTIPAGIMGTNGMLRTTVQWLGTATATTKTINIRYASTACTPGSTCTTGTNIMSTTQTSSDAFAQTLTMTRNLNANNSQTTYGSTGIAPYSAGYATAAPTTVNNSAATYLNINCTDGTTTSGTEYCGIQGYTVELISP